MCVEYVLDPSHGHPYANIFLEQSKAGLLGSWTQRYETRIVWEGVRRGDLNKNVLTHSGQYYTSVAL